MFLAKDLDRTFVVEAVGQHSDLNRLALVLSRQHGPGLGDTAVVESCNRRWHLLVHGECRCFVYGSTPLRRIDFKLLQAYGILEIISGYARELDVLGRDWADLHFGPCVTVVGQYSAGHFLVLVTIR